MEVWSTFLGRRGGLTDIDYTPEDFDIDGRSWGMLEK
jgi:hypothetical protein